VTVAAIILSASPEGAIADADGLPSVRRIADVAWSGGAVPIVVVSADPQGAVATALAGAPVTLAEPAPVDQGPKGQMARGLDVAQAEIQDLTGALIWPARMVWVGPETVTSMIEAHGTAGDDLLRPDYEDEPGWPVLLPVSAFEALRATAPDRMPPGVIDDIVAAGIADRHLALGDPGVTHDRDIARSDLPPYVGPVDPPAGHVHEWGAQIADQADDAPLDGPSLAPYPPAASEAEGV
jgi:CTP:molybdopterin cytidylyltransferase MocA